MSNEQKEKLLKEITQMKPEDKAFVIGYCAACANEKQPKKGDTKEC